jgi:hypothetical protein
VISAQQRQAAGLPAPENKNQALAHATEQVAKIWPGAGQALASVFDKNPKLLVGAAQGRTEPVLAAMRKERVSPDSELGEQGRNKSWLRERFRPFER